MSQVFDQDDFGEKCLKIVLTGRRISSDKLETGFHFKHRNLEDTLRVYLNNLSRQHELLNIE
jgi:NAD dependent epimerase/dehydratase family enzyme